MKPTQEQLILPLVELVRQEKAVGAKAAAAVLAERMGLDRSIREEVVRTSKGQRVAVWRRHVRFAALKARTAGLLDLKDGIWRPTASTEDRLKAAVPTIVVMVAVDEAGAPRMAKLTVGGAIPTAHTLVNGDARDLSFIPSESVGLVVTSVPYADLIRYDGGGDAQLGDMQDYEAFLDELDRVWAEISRVLMPGGRMACVVGDVLRSRKLHGRHHVLPLAADIAVRSRRHGLDALTPIQWDKVGNVGFEQGGRGRLGRPGMPNQIIQAQSETILMLRRPGYRSPSSRQIETSRLTPAEEAAWLRHRWDDIPGQRRARDGHPAPYPLEIATRLVRLFSFAEDVVLDPFAGSFTTTLAAMNTGRSSIGVEISDRYFGMGLDRVERHAALLQAA